MRSPGPTRVLQTLLLSLGLSMAAAGDAAAGHVNAIRVEGIINSWTSDFIQGAIEQSETDGAEALLIEMDTPGGVLTDTKEIIQAMLNTELPVIVYVSPKGAWAASAGTFITLASHVAAMAPGTSIGAASPISASGGGTREEDGERSDVAMEKAEKMTMAMIESIAKERKRNVEWALSAVREAEAIPQDEALKLGVIDFVASDRDELLKQIDGLEIAVGQDKTVVLDLQDVDVRTIEMTGATRFFNFLASPDIAFLLVMLGVLGLYIEFQQPGLLVPGIAGACLLILAAFAFQVLPFSWVGLLLIVIGMALLVLEIFVTSFGVLFTLGIISILVGGSMIFDVPEMGDFSLPFWTFLVPVVAGFAIVAGGVVFIVARSIFGAQTAGVDELIGLIGVARTPLAPNGKVFVRGEYWSATGEQEIERGESVEVTAVEGMSLRVRRARSASRNHPGAAG